VAIEPVVEATVPAKYGASFWEEGLIFSPRRSCL
jgi:hypothetical protein